MAAAALSAWPFEARRQLEHALAAKGAVEQAVGDHQCRHRGRRGGAQPARDGDVIVHVHAPAQAGGADPGLRQAGQEGQA